MDTDKISVNNETQQSQAHSFGFICNGGYIKVRTKMKCLYSILWGITVEYARLCMSLHQDLANTHIDCATESAFIYSPMFDDIERN